MRILLTGVTSFTGAWFARALVAGGHTVVAAVRGTQASYTGLRAARLALLEGKVTFLWGRTFGSQDFLAAIHESAPIDLFCHHGADATDYKSPDFNALGAVAANCRDLPLVLAALAACGCRRVLLTGSVFEAHEGGGTAPLRAFSPYGLSKTLTAEAFRYYVARAGLGLGKFVIPNPFGPYEEARFTGYLLNCWRQGRTARVNTPDYIRDNVPVSLLALAYADFAAALPPAGFHKFNPSYYVESQGTFAARFAREIGTRLRLEAPLELATQIDFPEPVIRINTDRIILSDPGRWQEAAAWDEAAAYYRDEAKA